MKKIQKKIANLIINWVMRKWGDKIINRWVYFTLNYPCVTPTVRDRFVQMYGKHMGDHFYGKFDYFYDKYGSRAVIHETWVEMTSEYRKQLFQNWFLDDYANNDFYKGEWV